MQLIDLNLPSPRMLRGGWAALAAVCASRGWTESAYADPHEWAYHDGGGNWACLRFQAGGRAVLLGNDHEYSNTYFGPAALYFDEEETDLLAGAPDWWSHDLNASPFGEWIGFIYGWDGHRWQRASYEKEDGFEQVGLVDSCSVNNTNTLRDHAAEAPGLNGRPPSTAALTALVAADANVSRELLEAVAPGWDMDAGVAAARRFLGAEC